MRQARHERRRDFSFVALISFVRAHSSLGALCAKPSENFKDIWLGIAFGAALGSSGSTALAGQILRGASSATEAGSALKGSAAAAAATAALGGANAREVLARTNQTLQALKAMQTEARRISLAGARNLGADPNHPGHRLSNVPDGLAVGGLQVAPLVPARLSQPKANEDASLWQGAALPVQTTAGTKTTVTVKQNSEQAFLTWKTFNIGIGTTLKFDQSAGGSNQTHWIAFNTILDPSGSPAQILGSIQAQGQVYVMNRNGIIFGGASEVNVHALVATSLPINVNLVSRGLLNNPDSQFLFSALPIDTGKSTAAFTPTVSDPSFTVSVEMSSHVLADPLIAGSTPIVTYKPSRSSAVSLTAGNDYTLTTNVNGRTAIQFTADALAKIGAAPVSVSYRSATVRYGNISVQKGAVLSSPTSADHAGGRIALIGPNVTNAGTISTPDGQTILAAGLQVGLTAHSTNDPTLRGLDVYVGAVNDSDSLNTPYAGTASNSGVIEAFRASVTIAGKFVNQLGAIDSTTSVSLNGRIDLSANYGAMTNTGFKSSVALGLPAFLPRESGEVTFGSESVTRILPETASTERAVGSSLALPSIVNVQGKTIHMESGATLLAPNASLPQGTNAKPALSGVPARTTDLTLAAGVTLSAGNWIYDTEGGNQKDQFVFSGGQVYLDSGATINVAGSTDVSALVSENVLSLTLRGPELADSPLQRNGALRGKAIEVDVRQSGVFNGRAWAGTPLGDTSGYVALIDRTVGELSTDGGTVQIQAGQSVVLQRGSTIDVSGGTINYQGGVIKTTKVLYNGHVIDISQATPDRIYDGIYDGTVTYSHPRWGVVETFTDRVLTRGHYESGYTYGGNGGSVSITAPTMALDGSLLGTTVTGPRQQSSLPKVSNLSLKFQNQSEVAPLFSSQSPNAPKIVFSTESDSVAVASFSLSVSGEPSPLPEARKSEVVLSPELLSKSGFGNLNIDNGDGDIVVPTSVTLATAPGGSISLSAANIDIAGKLSAPGGNLTLTAYNLSPFTYNLLKNRPDAVTPSPDSTRGRFTLASTATLSTAGLTIDDRPGQVDAHETPLVTNGGSITIRSYSADLQVGSTIDASGGGGLTQTGKPFYGDGGSITISAGQDPNLSAILGGYLSLKATLSAYSGSKGGALSLQAPLIQIGGASTPRNTLVLAPEFFDSGGFASFTLSGLGEKTGRSFEYTPALTIAPGTILAPTVQSLKVAFDATGGVELTPFLQAEAFRSPVKLTLNAAGVTDLSGAMQIRGDLIVGAGSLIEAGANGSVSLTGNTVAVLGSIFAPGGTISISGGRNSTTLFADTTQALATVVIGANSVLSTSGAVLLSPDSRGYRTGNVLSGGAINLTGNIVAVEGSELDVSGASGVLDVSPNYVSGDISGPLSRTAVVSTRVESDGGAITIKGGQLLLLNSKVTGAAGGTSAQGGSLSITSDRFTAPDSPPSTPVAVTLEVTQHRPTLLQSAAIGHAVLNGDGNPIGGYGHFAADTFNQSGMDSLSLHGVVHFSGPVMIEAPRSLTIADNGILSGDSSINLTAPYVSLGTAFETPHSSQQTVNPFTMGLGAYYFKPTFGTGKLTVTGRLIDIGTLSLQNIGHASFIADNGDIRGDGTLDIAGSLYLRAGQIYPPTAVSFTIAASDYAAAGKTHPGTVTIAASGDRSLPLSAGGHLNIFGSIINQGGVLRAPLGAITLGWNGTGAGLTDAITGQTVASTHSLTLSAGSITSVSAIDSITGEALTIPYGINLNGTAWIDPAGTDITAGGVPQKSIQLSAEVITQNAGASIDIRGGGDLHSSRWVGGTGGSTDILASTTSFAVIPGYQADYAPYAAFNASPVTTNLDSAAGYVNAGLSVGDRVYLGASSGLPAGFYTLLPARYALLSGAFLVTPKTGTPSGSVTLADGSSLVSGYRLNDLKISTDVHPLYSKFEVASGSVVRNRAQYEDYSANTFLPEGASSHDAAVPRLPIDSGKLLLAATRSMTVHGSVASQAPDGAKGGEVDISSPSDILIAGEGASAQEGVLVLDASQLSAFGADSLLIGGMRQGGAQGTSVTVTSANVTVDNAGSPLLGRDVILAANKKLTLAPGADVEQVGALSTGGESLLLGNAESAGSGDGVLLRVSNDASASITRFGVDTATAPSLMIAAGAKITGQTVILDSTSKTTLNPEATLRGSTVSLNSGQIAIQLKKPGTLPSAAGLVLSSQTLRSLQTVARSLSLLSYSSIDLYGTGRIGTLDSLGSPTLADLSLHAGSLRGYNNSGGSVIFSAQQIHLDNSALGSGPGAPLGGVPSGTLAFNANTIDLGDGHLQFVGYDALSLNASNGIAFHGSGDIKTQGALTMKTPYVTGANAASYSITADGALTTTSPAISAETPSINSLGASLTLRGASVTESSAILLPSGLLAIHATGAGGDVTVGGRLDLAGTVQQFSDVQKFTSGGSITLTSDNGDVRLSHNSYLSVAAQSGGGDGGTLSVNAKAGAFTLAGTVLGGGGNGGNAGAFSLDTRVLPSLVSLDNALNSASFTLSRLIRVRTGDVLLDALSTATAHTFNLSADAGSITIAGSIDASGADGGTIDLQASGGVTLAHGAVLTVAGRNFDHAGKGGSVTLETRGYNGGVIDLKEGARVDLSIHARATAIDEFTGTLHMLAPQTADGSDLQVAPIRGTITNASSIVVEGYRVYDLTAAGGAITDAVRNEVRTDGNTLAGSAGTTAVSYSGMLNRLANGNAGLASSLIIEPGAEIVNRAGNLTLGTATSSSAEDWDLSGYRFGPKSTPGGLTLRAAGDLVFYNALSDGFTSSAYNAALIPFNPLLPGNTQSWSYRLVAGADLTAADTRRVVPADGGAGSLQLGKDDGIGIALPYGINAITGNAVKNYFQTIRTGAGSIDIAAQGNVQLLNQFATVYTAGAQIANPTMNGAFDVPIPDASGGQSTLGAIQENPYYPVQYSFGGGNVTIVAQGDILHQTRDRAGRLIDDSERQLPINWLYRRGYVDSLTGQFGAARYSDIASTTWWVDFSNFYEGVGTLGGGNVTLIAGGNISNVDAVSATNARMPKGKPNASNLVELGGGDVVVRAGKDIDGGVYYVERGKGTLVAGGSIHTNSTRSPSLTTIKVPADIYAPETWLPTTLFLGKGNFDVSASGDLLLGPVADPFLLPEGYSNSFWYKTWFSTYAATDALNVSSLTGNVTLREAATIQTGGAGTATPLLQTWLQKQLLLSSNPNSASFYQPWLRLDESSLSSYSTVAGLLPATLRVTAFSSDISVVGNLTLSPSSNGTLDLLAAGAINGLEINGQTSINGVNTNLWGASQINVSDADTNAIPGVDSPFAYQTIVGLTARDARTSTNGFLSFVDDLFKESGSTQGAHGVLQTKQTLHAAGVLHANDSDPIRLYAGTGSISGITVFSPKAIRAVAGLDITDIALYAQNINVTDISVVAAGRDIIAYDPNSPLRQNSQSSGNALNLNSQSLAGDIQIGGPGLLEVLAGRNLDLGVGPGNSDGTGVGILSLGNARNPWLPATGASVIAGAGIGASSGLGSSQLDFTAFTEKFLDPGNADAAASGYAARYLPALGTFMGLNSTANEQVWTAFNRLPSTRREALALEIFYLVLRDAGRDHSIADSNGYQNYGAGFAAIATLFPSAETWNGNISLTSREIKTASGGNISLFAPGGGLTVGFDISGNQAAD